MPPKDKKEKPAGWNFDTIEIIYILILLSALFGTVVPAILSYVNSGEASFFGIRLSSIIGFFVGNAYIFKTIGFVIAAVGALLTFIFTKKGDAVWRELHDKMYPVTETPASGAIFEDNPMKDRWKIIVENSESDSPSNWRLAIIDADIILSDLLDKLNLPGDTVGEKLKAVERSDFNTIDSAWEAHKVRNMIAHDSQFSLNQRETRRVIGHYEAVFKEFYLI